MLHELRFNFFDKQVVKDPDAQREGQYFDKFKDVTITTSSCGRGQLLVGDENGFVYCIDRQLRITNFRAYSRSTAHLYQSRTSHTLVSIGFDEESVNPVVKVWNMEKFWSMDRLAPQVPHCSRITQLVHSGPHVGKDAQQKLEVTCLAVHENLQCMAIGYRDGHVSVFKGDITKDRTSKQRTMEMLPGPVTSIGIRSHLKTTVLFVTTDREIYSVNISSKDTDHMHRLESFGAGGRCTTMTDSGPNQSQSFLVGANDGVYFYEPEGRGACLGLQGEKLQVKCYRGYLVVIGQQSEGIARAMNKEMNIVTVYDMQSRYIAYSAPFPRVVDVLFEWGALYLLCADKRFYKLEEKDTQTKLEVLFKKNQYQLAINLAKSQQYDSEGLVNIFRQYGDHLYKKGDHDGAIAQYVKTIGKLEPSYVIRQFLDAQRIHNLTLYLEELHSKQQATEDHTTLLLNCYTKLKDETKLKHFILGGGKELNFDIETAIRVLRQASYHTLALHLAERQQLHEWYMKIQLENVRNYGQALKYMGNLNFEEAKHNMQKYGRLMVNELPREATEFLKKLCSRFNEMDSELNVVRRQADAEDFIHLFVNNSQRLLEFLEFTIETREHPSPHVYHTVLELLLQSLTAETDIEKKVETERKTLALLENPKAKYDVNRALVLCQMNSFKAGILYLYDKERLYQQILQYHMDHGEYSRVVESCRKYGSKDPQIWEMALSYFAQKEDDCKAHLKEVLGHIDKENLLPPLMVIQALSQSPVCTLGVIKEFITKRLKSENEQIAEDERQIEELTAETEKMKVEIEELKTSPVVFQSSNCSVCGQGLELPSVHFLCKHSYHQQCFESYSENENECPACLPENRKTIEAIQEQERNRELHRNFKTEMDDAVDGFSVVADFFGKGLFNKIMLVNDHETSSLRPAARNPGADNQGMAGPQTSAPSAGSREGRHVQPGSSASAAIEPTAGNSTLGGVETRSAATVPSVTLSRATGRAEDLLPQNFPAVTQQRGGGKGAYGRDLSPSRGGGNMGAYGRSASPVRGAGSRSRDASPGRSQASGFGFNQPSNRSMGVSTTGQRPASAHQTPAASGTSRPISQSRSSDRLSAHPTGVSVTQMSSNRSSDSVPSLAVQQQQQLKQQQLKQQQQQLLRQQQQKQQQQQQQQQARHAPPAQLQSATVGMNKQQPVKVKSQMASISNPFGSPGDEEEPDSSNPFGGDRKGGKNPFESASSKSRGPPSRSNPFEDSKPPSRPPANQPANPFEEEDSGGAGNPFEDKADVPSSNPFE